jgi:hypothetical protein
VVVDAAAGREVTCKNCGERITAPREGLDIPDPGPEDALPGNSLILRPRHRRLNFVLLLAIGVMLTGMLLPWVWWPDDTNEAIVDDFGQVILGIELPVLVNGRLAQRSEHLEANLTRARAPKDFIGRERARLDSAISASRSLYLLWLVPIVAVATLVDELRSNKAGRNHWPLRVANAFSLPFALIGVFLVFALAADAPTEKTSSAGPDMFESLSFGIWIVALGAVLSFISVFTSPNARFMRGETE